jgi:hypothetical protein
MDRAEVAAEVRELLPLEPPRNRPYRHAGERDRGPVAGPHVVAGWQSGRSKCGEQNRRRSTGEKMLRGPR